MRFTRTNRARVAGFDMTPMIDVVFQLIIFFLYTSQFTRLTRTPLDLPEQPGDALEAVEPADITIDIDRDGVYLIEREAITLDGIRELLAFEQVAGPVRVLVRADRSLPAGSLNGLATMLTDAGISGWELGTAKPAGSP